MMKTKQRKPNWFILDLLFMIFLMALCAESQLALTSLEHALVLVLLIVVGFGSIGVWIAANAAGLSELGRDKRDSRPYTITFHTVPPCGEGNEVRGDFTEIEFSDKACREGE